MRMSCSLTEQKEFLFNKLPISLSYFLTILSAPQSAVGSNEVTISLSATLFWMGAEER